MTQKSKDNFNSWSMFCSCYTIKSNGEVECEKMRKKQQQKIKCKLTGTCIRILRISIELNAMANEKRFQERPDFDAAKPKCDSIALAILSFEMYRHSIGWNFDLCLFYSI